MASGPKEDDDVAPGMDREELGRPSRGRDRLAGRTRGRRGRAGHRPGPEPVDCSPYQDLDPEGCEVVEKSTPGKDPAGTSKYHITRSWCA
jgi:hypothetical protein